jgi:hypothetical protein
VTKYAGLIGLQRSAPITDGRRTDEKSYHQSAHAGRHREGQQLPARVHHATDHVEQPGGSGRAQVSLDALPGTGMTDGEVPGTGVTLREDLMDAALERLNDRMRDVAAAESIPLYDLARLLPKSLQYFYDDCHFNTNGAATTGEGLSTFLAERGLVRKN